MPAPATRKRTPPTRRTTAGSERIEGDLEALLVDEAAGEQDQPLVRRGMPRAQRCEVADRPQVELVDPIRDDRHPVLRDAEDVGDMAAHVVAADDHALRAPRHPRLDGVDVRLRVVGDPALVAAVLGGVDRRHVRRAEPRGEHVGRRRDEPVVAVDDTKAAARSQGAPGGGHAVVQLIDPAHERAELARRRRSGDAVHANAGAHLVRRVAVAAARQHVHRLAVRGERLGELADVAREAALDDRRVLPREDQDAAHAAREPIRRGAIRRRRRRVRRHREPACARRRPGARILVPCAAGRNGPGMSSRPRPGRPA